MLSLVLNFLDFTTGGGHKFSHKFSCTANPFEQMGQDDQGLPKPSAGNDN